MCEPNHSIVQCPENRDDDQGPTMPLLQPGIKGKILEKSRKILQWLHFSKLGSGHSEAAIKVMLGFTRKRELLNSYWADDSLLWTTRCSLPPGQEGMEDQPPLLGAIWHTQKGSSSTSKS